MKPSTLIILAVAILGFGSGWMLKPSTSEATTTEQNPPSRKHADRSKLVAPGDRHAARIDAQISAFSDTSKAGSAELVALKLGKSFDTLKKRQDAAKLLRLSEALGLSEEQEKAISKLLNQRSNSFNPAKVGSAEPNDILKQAANAEGSFEQSLRALLDQEQLTRLDAYKTRETENRVEVQAQQSLTKLMSSVDLSRDQREAALDIYRNSSREQVESAPEGWHLLADSNHFVGGSRGGAERYRDLFSDPTAPVDPQEFRNRLAENQKELVEEKIDQIEGLLTPAQLEEFRTSLEVNGDFLHFVPPSNRDLRFRSQS